jgi:hypothetical protein
VRVSEPPRSRTLGAGKANLEEPTTRLVFRARSDAATAPPRAAVGIVSPCTSVGGQAQLPGNTEAVVAPAKARAEGIGLQRHKDRTSFAERRPRRVDSGLVVKVGKSDTAGVNPN